MFLKRIVLENIRGLRRLDLSFEGAEDDVRRWTMVLGENGTGKSTLLRSIALVLAGSEALPELLVSPRHWVRKGEQAGAIEADLVTAENKPRKVRLELRPEDTIREIFERNGESMAELDRALAQSARNYLTVGYGVSRRLSGKAAANGAREMYRHPRARAVASLFSPDALLNPLESWAINLHYKHAEEGLNVVRRTLSEFLPDLTFKGIDKTEGELLFETPDGVLPLSQLSDGYQDMAAWCGDLLYRVTEAFQDYKNPLSARGLLLVDEIDLHLHPAWQRRLIDFLTEKLGQFQVVATTHSPLTAQQAGQGQLFLLHRPSPEASPKLKPYEGNPQLLSLEQLAVSPIFGLATSDSPQVEKLKKQYRTLKGKKERSPAEETELVELEKKVTELPDRSRPTEHDRKTMELLQQLRAGGKPRDRK